MAKPEVQTKVISNFTGRLTHIINGDMNSGFAKFATSFGYDPFSQPGNLTWFENYSTIQGVSDLILSAKTRWIGESFPTVYAIGSTGNLYKIQISSQSNNSIHSVVGIASVKAGNPTYNKGASMEFFGGSEKIYIGSDNQVNSINFDGSGDALVGNQANYASSSYRPLKSFGGKLVFGNGPTIGVIDATGTVTSSVIGVSSVVGNIYSQLNPALGVEMRVRDLDVSPDNTYLLITAATTDYEFISQANTPNLVNTVPAQGIVAGWNGSDVTVTNATNLPQNFVTALQTYLAKNMFFAADTFGAALSDGTTKILTMPNNKSPFPNATGANGNFLFWSTPERFSINGDPTLLHSMFYYGQMDQENPVGLWRVMRSPSQLFKGGVVQVPVNLLSALSYSDMNIGQSSVITAGFGTHYFSTLDASNNAIQSGSVLTLNRFNVPATGIGNTQSGVYETQNELFSKRISIIEIRVYCDPTVSGNKFTLDVIGADGTPVTNGSFSYTFGDIVDPATGSTSVERINFDTNTKNLFSCGIRFSNIGIKNMVVRKIEVDYTEQGK